MAAEQNVNQAPEQPVALAPNPVATQDNDPYSADFERTVAGLHAHIQSKVPAKAEPKPEAKVEPAPVATEPVQQPVVAEQPKPITTTNREVPRHLLERAREHGWSDTKIESFEPLHLERTLNEMDATLVSALRRNQQEQPGPEQPQKVETPAVEKFDLWKGVDRKEVDPPLADALDRLFERFDKGHAPLAKEVEDLKKQVALQAQYINDHAQQSRAAMIDQIGDKLAAQGYDDVFGKGRAKPGTAAYENKGLLANYLRAAVQTFAQFNMQIDLDEQAENFARQRWGQRSSQPQQQQQYVDPQNLPRGQRPQVRDERPTATTRPTSRQPERPKGRESAVEAVNGLLRGWSGGGLDLSDVHDG